MLEHFPFYLSLIVAIVLLIMLANKIKVAYPVLLVIAGLLISFIPGIPIIHINPELIFIIFLPPMLYAAAWSISWKELWHWRRIIGSFAFVVVFLTATAVAFIANHFIPGFSLALGFLLGGIISPPDAVSAGAILKFVKVSKRMSSILEGESLLNDASSLIIFRFAMIAVATGQFIWYDAAVNFSWMLVGGAGIGLLIGWCFMKAHKHLPTDTNIDIVLTLVAPYIMYIVAEEVHSSGVLAVVCGGLYLSHNVHSFLKSNSRLQGFNFWESLVFVLNGLVFMLIGLDLPEITAGLALEGVSLYSAINYGVLITLVLIIGRILTAYGALIFTLVARNFITVADARNPGYKVPFVLGWTGMRGVVSLAAALSIPIEMADGTPFPQRNLILFITFVVILLTLLVQGLTLPYFIRKLNIYDAQAGLLADEKATNYLRKELSNHALMQLKTKHVEAFNNYPVLQQMAQTWEKNGSLVDDVKMSGDIKRVYLDILEQQRQWLLKKNMEDKTLDEDLIRKQLTKIDLEEIKLGYM
jgi:Na+/H+ antiporter